ncbi:MAG: EcsC family protein [Spirochaetes bacterium]|nr:EcsC family protein [Spirochaetota bacterium]
MGEKIEPSVFMKALDWCYDKAINGGGVLVTANDLAKEYLEKNKNNIDAAKSLIKWQIAKCATSGFITGLGGIITLPVAIPANISSVLYVQLRMIAAIAIMGGYDPKSDKVKTFVYLCLTGSSVNDILKTTGINIGSKVALNAIKNISGTVLREINKKVGFKLLTKFGQTGVVNLGKTIPLIGGIIGGLFDAGSTKIIGKKSIDVFLK